MRSMESAERRSEIRYAKSGDLSIGYEIFGDGPIDLVFVPFISNLVFGWRYSACARFYEELGSFSRLVQLDKRGMGVSDRPRGVPTLEAQMDDVRAVMDAIGSERAGVFGSFQGGLVGALFAATYPERTRALVLYNPHTAPASMPAGYRRQLEQVERGWGTREYHTEIARTVNPTLAADERFLDWFVDYHRLALSPGAAAAFWRMLYATDVSDVLPAIRVPTLVVYREQLRDEALEVAARIPGAQAVVVPGPDYAPYAGSDVTREVERFLTGHEEEPVPESVLTTVLFTDLVDSTSKAAELGDRRWRGLLEQHHARIRAELARYRGSELDTAGDGFLASFDGPARAIRCACAVREALAELGLEIRAGLHTGECELLDGKVAGIAVSIGARVAAQAAPGEVLVSQTVKDLVAGSGLEFEDRGAAELKGVPGEWRLYAVAA
jgi:class 3 adenylate cyclase